MNKIKIITDSTCDLSPELVKSLDLEIIPLNVTIGDETYRDLVELTTEDLYKKVDETGVMPKTAAVSPALLEDVFKKYVDLGYDVIFTGIGSKFSVTFNNAVIASQDMPNVYCIDSANLSSGTGLIILKIGKLISEGKSASEIKEYVEANVVPNVRSAFAINTFEYLHKGGRCTGITKLLGTMLKIKPIIEVRDGEMHVAKKPLGKMKKAIKIILEDVVEHADSVDTDCIMCTHSLNDEMADYIIPKIKAALPSVEAVHNTKAGCVISSHCGQGTIGILYVLKP